MAIAAVSAAVAADQPIYGPEPSWVKVIDAPPAMAADGAGSLQLLLSDQQSHLTPEADSFYVRSVFKILNAQGLQQAGTILELWRPDTDTLTVHHVRVLRDNAVIDLLAGGKTMTVLRREQNLERAMLDGALTATLQPEDLRVGDVLDVAITVERRDPVRAGRSETGGFLAFPGIAGRVRMRATWPDSEPVRWRTTAGLDNPVIVHANGQTELTVDMSRVTPPKPPAHAPWRFHNLGQLEVSGFADWADLSSVMAPLYAKAESLGPHSPLRAEIERIKTSAATPRARALAALQLVESQTRYLLLAMNLGGYVPADADTTWSRRFGDCKGKTVLLLALLHGLGIEAQPALVSTELGDGLDEHLPMLGLFDHVLVRAVIDGRVYWLDGTRQGDRALESLPVPGYHFALPLQAGGARPEALRPTDPLEPETELSIAIDASSGDLSTAPIHIQHLFRGEAALAMRLYVSATAKADIERALRQGWSHSYPWITVREAQIRIDEASGQVISTMDGQAALHWQSSGPAFLDLHVPESDLGGAIDVRREPGPNQDAPYAVDYPHFSRWVTTIRLPAGGRAFALVGAGDVDQTVAGVAYKRTSRIVDGEVRMIETVHAVVQEYPASEAPAAAEALRAMGEQDVYLRRLVSAPAPAARAAGSPAPAVAADDGAGLASRAVGEMSAGRYAEAAADFTRALVLNPTDPKLLYNRGAAWFAAGETDKALQDFQAALKLVPGDRLALMARAAALLKKGEQAHAAADYRAAERAAPQDKAIYQREAMAYEAADLLDQAVANWGRWIEAAPDSHAKAAALAARCWDRLRVGADLAAALADCDAAASLEPQDNLPLTERGYVRLRMGKVAEAERDFTAALAIDAHDPWALYGRSVARGRTSVAAQADLHDALAADGNVQSDARRLGVDR